MNLEDYDRKLYLGGCLWQERPPLIHDINCIFPSPSHCLTATFLMKNCSIDIVIFPDFSHSVYSNSPVPACQISYKINLYLYFTIPLWMELSKITRNVKTSIMFLTIWVFPAPELRKVHENLFTTRRRVSGSLEILIQHLSSCLPEILNDESYTYKH